MSWLDIVIVLPLLIGLVRGLMKGLVVELTAIVAIVIGLIGTKQWGAAFSVWLLQQFVWPEAVCTVVAYTLLFLGITISLNIVARLLTKLFKAAKIGWLNRLLGGLFGTTKWAAIVLLVVLCVHRLDDQFHFFQQDLKQQSIIYNYTTPLSEKAWEKAKQEIHAFTKQRLDTSSKKDEQK